MYSFSLQTFDQQVLFDVDHRAVLPELAETLGLSRLVVLTTSGHATAGQVLAAGLGNRLAGHFAGARMHTPVEVTEAALAILGNADGVVSLGGGSAIGLGKALTLRAGVRHIAIPTTYAGSEMTPILGQTEGVRKTTLRDNRLVPAAVIYDVGLTQTLPARISADSGLNAMAHAIEALYAPDRDPVTDLLAEQAIRALAKALPEIYADTADVTARTLALYGAFLAGRALASTTMGLHHKLAHVLGGLFDLPHAAMHAVLLPYVVEFNELDARDLLRPAARGLGAATATQGLLTLSRRLGVPRSLSELGMPAGGIDQAVEQVTSAPPANPRGIEAPALRHLLELAREGRL